VTPSTLVLVVASGTLPSGDAGGKSQLALLTQMRQAGGLVVVAGDAPSATGGGLVAPLRGDNGDRSGVSSVDNSDTEIGQVSTILALDDASKSHFGQFGTGSNVDALFPSLSNK